MSLKKLCLTSLLVVIASAGYCFLFIQPTQANVSPKFGVPTSEFSGYGPVDRIIKIKILEDEIASDDQTAVKVKTKITMPFDYQDNLDYKWILGENVKLVDGNLIGKIGNFKANEPQTVEISVRGFSKLENRQIAVQVSGEKNGRRVFADGIIASQKENTFEDIVQHVEKIKSAKKEEDEN